MPFAGNPRKLAYDVAQGFQQFTPATLRAYNLEELKVLLFNLNIVLREVRASQVPLEDIDALKDKNVKIRRLNQSINTIQSYASLRGHKL